MAWADGSEEITNSADIIDSREVIARIDWLNPWKVVPTGLDVGQYVDEFKTREEAEERISEMPEIDRAGFEVLQDEDEAEELAKLEEFARDGENSASDWLHGATLIRDSYFEDYAREYARDVSGFDPDKLEWPMTCIDWEEAAEELQVDYSSIEFDGVTYWVR